MAAIHISRTFAKVSEHTATAVNCKAITTSRTKAWLRSAGARGRCFKLIRAIAMTSRRPPRVFNIASLPFPLWPWGMLRDHVERPLVALKASTRAQKAPGQVTTRLRFAMHTHVRRAFSSLPVTCVTEGSHGIRDTAGFRALALAACPVACTESDVERFGRPVFLHLRPIHQPTHFISLFKTFAQHSIASLAVSKHGDVPWPSPIAMDRSRSTPRSHWTKDRCLGDLHACLTQGFFCSRYGHGECFRIMSSGIWRRRRPPRALEMAKCVPTYQTLRSIFYL